MVIAMTRFSEHMKNMIRTVCIAAAVLALSSCATGTIFPQLTDELTGISSLAVDADFKRLYVVNANDKVAYDWKQGSFQVYDISDPLSPVLMKTTPILSFSGKIQIDTTRKIAYITNRYSEDDNDVIDRLYIFDIDESSDGFMTYQEIDLGRDPFGIVCCYPDDRMWIAEGGKDKTYKTQYVDKADLKVGDVDMLVDLSNGGYFSEDETTDLAIIGQMGFFSRSRGGIVVVNLAEVGVPGAEPVDYWISDIRTPRGVATDGTRLFVVSEEDESGRWVPWVHVLDVSTLVPLTDNTEAQVMDKDTDGLLVTSIGLNERRDPQEILITQDYAFVTSGWNEDNFVHVIDLDSLTWVKEIAVGDEPFAMALYAPGGVDTYVYVANQIDNTIQVIDIATLSVVATYP